MNRNSVVEYINSLNPTNPLEMVHISSDVKALAQALIDFMERTNASRKVKLWEQESQDLQNEIKGLVHDIEKAKELNNTYQELISKRDRLLVEKNEIQDLVGQTEEIERLEDFMSKYDYATLNAEFQKMKVANTGNLSIIQEWVTAANSFFYETKSSFLDETKILLKQMYQNREELNVMSANLSEALTLNRIEISRLLETYNADLKIASNEYNDVVEQLGGIKAKLGEIERNHAKNVVAYQTHFAQNQAIWGELGKRHRLDEYLNELFKAIEENLLQFDTEIKSLIEKTDHIIVF